MSLYSGDRFTIDGREFLVRFEHDSDHGAPWEECDGHGIIREGYMHEKRAGHDGPEAVPGTLYLHP